MQKKILEILGVLLVVFGIVATVYSYVFGALASADPQVSGQQSALPLALIPSLLIFLVAALLPFVGAFLCFRAAAKD